jgi:hypothetical protein
MLSNCLDVSEGSRRSRLVETAGVLIGYPHPQLLPAFPKLTIGVVSFCPLLGCKYLRLVLSAAC